MALRRMLVEQFTSGFWNGAIPDSFTAKTFGAIRSDLIGMKRWLQAVKTVTVRPFSGWLSHPQLVTYVTDTPGWMIRLLPSTISPTHHSFHMRTPFLPLRHLPHAIGGSLLSPHTAKESDCHNRSAVSAEPICHHRSASLCPGNIRRGLAAPQGDLMTSVYAHSYRTAQRLDSCQGKQQVRADISCNLCVSACGHCCWFSQPCVIT